MNNKQLAEKLGRPILKWILLAKAIFVIGFISTPFVWIWIGFYAFLKVLITSIIGVLITNFFNYVTKKVCEDYVNKTVKNESKKTDTRSKFTQRMEKVMEEHKKKPKYNE